MPDDMAAAAAVVVPQTLVRTVGMVACVRLVPRLATAPETARQVFLPSPLKSLAVRPWPDDTGQHQAALAVAEDGRRGRPRRRWTRPG
ncbi:hypothetical protein ABID95_004381 [Streptomyces atratus]